MVNNEIIPENLEILDEKNNTVRTVFHPEYSYSDFMGKVMPITNNKGSIEYNYYAGHFLRAVGKAYSNILENGEDAERVALVIDEINRGNSSSIFGNVFQLLDRDRSGWSENPVNISDLQFGKLMDISGMEVARESDDSYRFDYGGERRYDDEVNEVLDSNNLRIRRNQIMIPYNLSILATMNTSDSSVFYMDTAFKRRWEWQYVNTKSECPRKKGIAFNNRKEWEEFVNSVNVFIKKNHTYIRNVENYLIGHWFIPKEEIAYYDVQNKLMFYMWDSVFSKSKGPLRDLIGSDDEEITTFGDFSSRVEDFINKVKQH